MKGPSYVTTPLAQCEGKPRFDSFEAAKVALDSMRRRHTAQGGINAYRCPHCSGWHVGCGPRMTRARRGRPAAARGEA